MAVFKWLLGALIGLLLLLALAVLILPRVVDPNDFRGEISQLVESQTGRKLSLNGDLNISVFPWLGINTQGLALSQPEQIGGDMLTVESAQLRLKLAPLLSKRLEIDTIVLESPSVNLVTLADGTSSFTGLVSEDDAELTDSEPQSDAASAVALVVQGVQITDAKLVWDDRQAGQKIEVKDLNLETGDLLSGEYVPLALSGSLIDSANPTPLKFSVNGDARLDIDTLVVDVQKLGANVAQAEQTVQLNLDSLRFQQEQSLSLKGLGFAAQVQIPSETEPQALKLEGSLNTLDMPGGPSGQKLNLGALDIKADVAQREIQISAPSTTVNLDAQVAEVAELALKSQDLDLRITNLKASQFIDAPALKASIDLRPFDLSKLLADLEIDYQAEDPQALKNVAFSGNLAATTNSASVDKVLFRLDDSTLQGNVAIRDFESLATQFDLQLDQLNLDSYLPATTEAEQAVEDEAIAADALALPMAALKAINANGSFKAGSLISGGVKLQDIDVQVESKAGQLKVTPNAKLYDGSLGGLIAFNDGGDQSSLSINQEIDLVSLGQLLTDADITSQLSGIGSLVVDVDVLEKNGVQSNQGTIKLLAKNGALKGIDIKKMLDTAVQTYQQFTGSDAEQTDQAEEQQADSQASDETKFAELLGTFKLDNYKITNDDFSLKAPLFRVTGKGEFDVAAQTMDYLVNLVVVNTTDGQGGKGLDDLAGISIPVRLSGDLTAPSYSLDMRSLYQSYVKREIDRKKGELLQEELGIEGGESLSTKDIIKGALLKKWTDREDPDQPESEPVPYDQTGSDQVGSDQAGSDQTQDDPEPREPTKKEQRDELKRKLLDSIFN